MEVLIVGEARIKNIKRKCCYCDKKFILSCNDYVSNKFGVILIRPEGDDWLCKECYDFVNMVKNL